MTDILLGLIALGALTTALIQAVVIVSLVKTARRNIARVERLRALAAPLSAHLASIRGDFARAQEVAGRQLGRVALMYDTVEPPVRKGLTALAVLRGVSRVVRRARRLVR